MIPSKYKAASYSAIRFKSLHLVKAWFESVGSIYSTHDLIDLYFYIRKKCKNDLYLIALSNDLEKMERERKLIYTANILGYCNDWITKQVIANVPPAAAPGK